MRRAARVLCWLSLCLGLRMGLAGPWPVEAGPEVARERLRAVLFADWLERRWLSRVVTAADVNGLLEDLGCGDRVLTKDTVRLAMIWIAECLQRGPLPAGPVHP